ncbi:MAG: hypothetical protein WCJ30_09195 [Deltaproteobacteria bacterium]
MGPAAAARATAGSSVDPACLTRVAIIGPDTTAMLSRRWSIYRTQPDPFQFSEADAMEYLGVIIEMARLAVAQRHELFVWMCP